MLILFEFVAIPTVNKDHQIGWTFASLINTLHTFDLFLHPFISIRSPISTEWQLICTHGACYGWRAQWSLEQCFWNWSRINPNLWLERVDPRGDLSRPGWYHVYNILYTSVNPHKLTQHDPKIVSFEDSKSVIFKTWSQKYWFCFLAKCTKNVLGLDMFNKFIGPKLNMKWVRQLNIPLGTCIFWENWTIHQLSSFMI